MPALLTLDRVSAATPDGGRLFSDLTLSVGREAVGLVGRNGSGKSTLLAMIAGERQPSSGTIATAGKVGRLRQSLAEDATVAEALGIADALARLQRLERGEGDIDDAALADWSLEERLDAAFARVGIAVPDPCRPIASLSGGERTRLGLAALLLEEPDVLLMDEPTNNLDAEGRGIIAELLAGWPGGALVASHDRTLLEAVDRIVELTPVGVFSFGGGWSGFEAAREARREGAEAGLERARSTLRQQDLASQRQRERKARRDNAGRAKAAKGDMPRILLGMMAERSQNSGARQDLLAGRLHDEAAADVSQGRRQVEIVTPLHIDLPSARLPPGRTLLRFDEVTVEHAGRRLFGPLSFSLSGPRRIAVSGPNGSGKTSLLRVAMGEAAPTSGKVWRAEGALALLDQHAALPDPALDLVSNMRLRHPGMTAREAHDVLARFAFRNRDALRPATGLSGGERLRAALALLTGGEAPPQLLLLDEPTNHLDLAAVEMLEAALAEYDGALLLVSHDRRFLEAVGIDEEITL